MTRNKTPHSGLRGHATVLAVALWAFAVLDFATPSPYLRYSGSVKGTDFVQFYTAAAAAKRGAYEALVSAPLFNAEQVRLVPESGRQFYPPVYGPQVALVLEPLAAFGYYAAYAAWITITAALYALSLNRLLSLSAIHGLHTKLIVPLAAGFPPLWWVVVHGQLSAVALISLAAAGESLRHRRRSLAGASLGLLAYKPSLFVPALAVLLFAGEWRIALTATTVGLAQVVLVIPLVGADVVAAYGRNLVAALAAPELLATKPLHLHSFRSFWSALLPTPSAMAAYLATAASLSLAGGVAWNRTKDPLDRLAVLSAVVVLVSRHCYSYDLLVLAPVFVWFGATLTRPGAAPPSAFLKGILYLSFTVPLWAPLSALFRLQLSTLVITALSVCVFWAILSPQATTGSRGKAQTVIDSL